MAKRGISPVSAGRPGTTVNFHLYQITALAIAGDLVLVQMIEVNAEGTEAKLQAAKKEDTKRIRIENTVPRTRRRRNTKRADTDLLQIQIRDC